MISVIINTYNQQDYIADAIKSVLEQDYSGEMEIVVVNDGSTDNTGKIVDDIIEKNKSISIIHHYKKNGGQATALNEGIKIAKGDIYCFLDGDDMFLKSKLSTIARYYTENKETGLIGHGILQSDGVTRKDITVKEKTYLQITDIPTAERFSKVRPLMGTSRMTMRASMAQKLFPIPEDLRFEADEYLYTKAPLNYTVLIVPDVLTYYRLHGNNLYMVNNVDKKKIRYKCDILYRIIEYNRQLVNMAPVKEKEEIERIINVFNFSSLADLGIHINETKYKEALKYNKHKKYMIVKVFGNRLSNRILSTYSNLRNRKTIETTQYL